ncbi:MAG: hypothetical protein R3285_11030 [Kiloniellales bacterium]|nr:hypothetical protein [Kiloniellales bacterium]
MIRPFYRLVMDEKVNPLRTLPRSVQFQLMSVLAFMWSAIFTLWVGSFWLLGPTVVSHVLVLMGVLFTADIFRRAGQRAGQRVVSYDETFRDPRDGCARHDDVWGGI